MRNYRKVGLVIFPLKSKNYECGQSFVNQLVRILSPLSDEIRIITGNYILEDNLKNVTVVHVWSPIINSMGESILSMISRIILSQFTISLKIIQHRANLETLLFFYSNGFLILPIMLCKLLNKKVVVITSGSFSKSTKYRINGKIGVLMSSIVNLIERFNFYFADIITVGSNSMITDLNIESYNDKILSNKPTYILNDTIFAKNIDFLERDNIVGYVGRLSAEKGVLEFINAIPLIASKFSDINFLIVGDGPLRYEMNQILQKNGCSKKVTFTGWISYDRVPDYLNMMRFHLLPSDTEALGGSNIEAMACGAISIANNVGGIPDIIINGETGFLLENNSPLCIEKKFLDIMNYSVSDLLSIQENAAISVKKRFLYRDVVESWKELFEYFDK